MDRSAAWWRETGLEQLPMDSGLMSGARAREVLVGGEDDPHQSPVPPEMSLEPGPEKC